MGEKHEYRDWEGNYLGEIHPSQAELDKMPQYTVDDCMKLIEQLTLVVQKIVEVIGK